MRACAPQLGQKDREPFPEREIGMDERRPWEWAAESECLWCICEIERPSNKVGDRKGIHKRGSLPKRLTAAAKLGGGEEGRDDDDGDKSHFHLPFEILLLSEMGTQRRGGK